MTAISVLPGGTSLFRAVRGTDSSTGATVGQAIDALPAGVLPSSETTLIIVQSLAPDRFFTAEQQARIQELMSGWRASRDSGAPFSRAEREELEQLIRDETTATRLRLEEMTKRMKP